MVSGEVRAAVPEGSADKSAAAKRHQDRLEIIIGERDLIAKRLKAAEAKNDEEAARRERANLATIDKEIVHVSTAPISKEFWQPSVKKNPAAPQNAGVSDTRALSYEAWDAFKNFPQTSKGE